MSEWLKARQSGVLLHISSLPDGNLGASAYGFVDFLKQSGFSVWQVLPLGPTLANGSPYQSPSANAGNPELIDLHRLVEWGWLLDSELTGSGGSEDSDVSQAESLRKRAFNRFVEQGQPEKNPDYRQFCESEAWWLDDFALFQALKVAFEGAPWWDWPADFRSRRTETLEDARERLDEEIGFAHFEQFVFELQWRRLRDYANDNGIKIFGDLPIFVAEDAVDVWVRPELFELDANRRPTFIAGVPPDYFSETGQRWGNPLYAWDAHQSEAYDWWVKRMARQFELYDILRIDHFRGFESYWSIPVECETAIDGQWRPGPGAALFDALEKRLGTVPVVAEDLGIITSAVEALRDTLAYPGMKILQFAFDGRADNPYLPHNLDALSVTYTGTHDNDTTAGWFEGLDENSRASVRSYFGFPAEPVTSMLIRAALASVSRLAVVPVQDLLGLDTSARMNTPGVAEGNWRWRLTDLDALEASSETWRRLNQTYGRAP
ncbi:MAG: 4-alpha-glucanotransferase [Gammaproteobacteria bacterium]